MSLTEQEPAQRQPVDEVDEVAAAAPAGPVGPDAVGPEPVDEVDELLVEEISIDGMCGVY